MVCVKFSLILYYLLSQSLKNILQYKTHKMLYHCQNFKFNTQNVNFLVYYKTAIWHCKHIINTEENKQLSTLNGNVMTFQQFYKITINVYKMSWQGTNGNIFETWKLSLYSHILKKRRTWKRHGLQQRPSAILISKHTWPCINVTHYLQYYCLLGMWHHACSLVQVH